MSTTTDTQQGETLLACWCREDTAYLRVKAHMDHGEFGCRERGRYVYCPNCWACGPTYTTDKEAIEGWNKSRRAAVTGPRVLNGSAIQPVKHPCNDPSCPLHGDYPDTCVNDPSCTSAATSSPTPAESFTSCAHCDGPITGGILAGTWVHTKTGLTSCRKPSELSREIFHAAPPESTRVEGEQRVFRTTKEAMQYAQTVGLPTVIPATPSADSARRAAEEIEIEFPQLPNYSADKVAAIISKYFAAVPADNDAESPPPLSSVTAMLCQSGSDESKVVLRFRELKDAQAVHKWLVTLRATTTKGDR